MRYRLPQTHSSLISISIAEFLLGNAPALRTRPLISRFTRSSILVVQIRLQCSSGKRPVVEQVCGESLKA